MLLRRSPSTMLAACAWVTLALAAAALAAEPQRRFATPEAALETFVEALGAGDPARLAELFGSMHMPELLGEDPVAARADLARAYAAAKETAALRPGGPERMTIVVGRVAWPFPIPLVHEPDGWRFDTVAGAEEIANRRVGRNELAAIEVMRAYVEAQYLYTSADRDGDGVLEYAQRLASTGDRRDGLYWPTSAGEAPSPFGPFLAEVGDYLASKEAGAPYRGYRFRVLTRQGANAPGGAYDYVINGNMVAGFALLAWPEAYGETGVMSFLVGNDGLVLEADLGPETDARARAIEAFEPDPSWQPTAD